MMIYLDNAATTFKKPQQVYDAVIEAMHHIGNSGRGVNAASVGASRKIYACREAVQELFHVPSADGVVFCANATEALNIAIFGTISPGDHVITTALEHNSVLRPLYQLERNGAELSILPADRHGVPMYEKLESLLRDNTKAIIFTHASNLTGNLVDVNLICSFAKQHGLLTIMDASQSAGCFKIDMQKSGIDILCFTGHKSLMGPQGTGGLCMNRGADVRPLLFGGTGVQSHLKTQPSQYPTRLEAGTLNGHGICGLLAGIEFIRSTGIDAIHAHEKMLMERFYAGIVNIPGVKIYGDFRSDRAPIVSLNIGDNTSSEIGDALSNEYGIEVRTGAHCAPLMHNALGTTQQGAVRFSFGYYNTVEEVDQAIRAVRELAEE